MLVCGNPTPAVLNSELIVVAADFFTTFSPELATHHLPTLQHLKSLSLPAHVTQDELARRFRNEKYLLRMSRSGFRLLVGWLTEGTGGEATGAGGGFTGESSRRGRSAVMQVVNNHITVEGNRPMFVLLSIADTM